MNPDPLATPASSEVGMETPLEHLQASTGGGLDFGFGALPSMANAHHANGPNVSSHQPVRPIGAGQPQGGTTRTVNKTAKRYKN